MEGKEKKIMDKEESRGNRVMKEVLQERNKGRKEGKAKENKTKERIRARHEDKRRKERGKIRKIKDKKEELPIRSIFEMNERGKRRTEGKKGVC